MAQMLDADAAQLRKTLVEYCCRLTGSVWDGEDLAQDTYLKALPFMETVNDMANPSAYLSRMARNRWIDQLRRQKRAIVLEKEALLADGAKAEETDSRAAVAMLLRQLTQQQTAVFLLRDALELSAKETATLLHMSEGAVKAALHRARATLRRWRERMRANGDNAANWSETVSEAPALLQAYVLALQEEDAQAIACLMTAGGPGSETGALQIRHQLLMRPLESRKLPGAPEARMIAA